MHLHTSSCSACARSSGEEMVRAAKEHGYTGIVITNHFYHGNTAIDRALDWREFVKAYRDDYLTAKAVGEELGMDVLFGIEEGYKPGKEALIYGIDTELIADMPELKNMKIEELSEFVRKNGGFIACAHPFRVRDYIPDPRTEPDIKLFDAVEAYNAQNSDEDNSLAEQLCKRTGTPRISGSDVHDSHFFGKGGLAFYERITDEKKLVSALKQGSYKLIKNGEIEL